MLADTGGRSRWPGRRTGWRSRRPKKAGSRCRRRVCSCSRNLPTNTSPPEQQFHLTLLGFRVGSGGRLSPVEAGEEENCQLVEVESHVGGG